MKLVFWIVSLVLGFAVLVSPPIPAELSWRVVVLSLLRIIDLFAAVIVVLAIYEKAYEKRFLDPWTKLAAFGYFAGSELCGLTLGLFMRLA